ncbi:MAG: protein-L-isoaspartate(D-aspartate) O-methyltransferase [Aquamicrobium sp.]|nr:protein-L-isoaspartate(D-aspartate) O-methyltransferase [Aquamicrobium sp.]
MEQRRRLMVENQIAARGVHDRNVLDAMNCVPRECFVDRELRDRAYEDTPLPIGEGQTISQPFIVAYMIEAARITPGARVLEVGAGCGYAAAVLSRIAGSVHAVERHASLGRAAAERLRSLGYDNVELRVADGTKGWPEAAPFDAIIVSAGGTSVPEALEDQLAPDGVLIMPVGRDGRRQRLLRVRRSANGHFEQEDLGGVAFVPLVDGA